MSRQKLTIVVTCTDRKSATPRDALMARNLRPGSIAERADAWRRALSGTEPTTQLLQLYRGEGWTQVQRLIATAHQVGYEPQVLVASAGLGLRSVFDAAPAYAATFSTGHADSVATSAEDAKAWWGAMSHTAATTASRALWVLSETYSRAIGTDLVKRLPTDELLVFGGSNEIPMDVRVRSDRRLRRTLGGTATSLNVRMATQWLLLADGNDPFGRRARAAWSSWSEREQHHEVYDRRPLSDDAVVKFVTALRAQRPDISKTRALKTLRDSGLACEQRRFSTLFQKVVSP